MKSYSVNITTNFWLKDGLLQNICVTVPDYHEKNKNILARSVQVWHDYVVIAPKS